MKALNPLFLVVVILVPAAAFADSSIWSSIGQNASVWNQQRDNSNSLEGRIKAIVVDEDQDRILVRVETGSLETETVTICDEKVDSTIRTLREVEKMNLMRQAFENGRRVRISYRSPFDRCVSKVVYSNTEKANAAAAQGGSI